MGLIGLRTVFPQGINRDRTPGIGPLTRERYRQRLPDLQTAIERYDDARFEYDIPFLFAPEFELGPPALGTDAFADPGAGTGTK